MHDYEIRREALRFFKEGKGYKIVARTLDISLETVRDWKKRYIRTGEAFFTENYIPPIHNRYTPEEKARAVEAARSGRSIKEVALKLGISPQSLRNWMSPKAS